MTDGCIFPASNITLDGTEQDWQFIPHTDVGSDVKAGCQLHGSLSAFLRAAWALLLHTHAGQPAISFAFFRSGISDGHSESTFCSNESHSRSEASIYSYQHVPHGTSKSLQPTLQVPFDESIVQQSGINTAIKIDSRYSDKEQIRLLQSDRKKREMQRFDLVLSAHDSCTLNDFSFGFRRSRVHPTYATTLSNLFRSIVALLARNSNHDLAYEMNAINLQLTDRWRPESYLCADSCVHTMIQSVVETNPSMDAVCAWDGSLTYRQLWDASESVAKHLVQVGLQMGSLVPFMFEKSVWALVAALAVLRAGGTLVPMNPNEPNGRRAEILQSLNAEIAVSSWMHRRLIRDPDIQVIAVTSENVAHWRGEALAQTSLPQVSPQGSVFVLFTSGSTGSPKGIVHDHRGIVSHALGLIHSTGCQGTRVFQFSSFIFDVAMMDIFTTLIGGGCTCVPSDHERVNDPAGAMRRMRVNYAMLTPSTALSIDPKDVPELRILALAGESPTQLVIDQWVGHVWLMNAYGPAEVGVCTVSTIEPGDYPTTIGPSIPHSACWVVDCEDHDRLLPVGAIGELLVAGSTIARGYLNNQSKTDASFINRPLWATRRPLIQTTFYKTGDLVRYNLDKTDGSLDYIGRKDNQIKIRGHRVELGDIEYYLAMVPGVSRCMVSFPRTGYYSGKIVAVVQTRECVVTDPDAPLCSDPEGQLSLDSIQTHIAGVLPEYMIPSGCITVLSLPLDASCKINRKRTDAWVASFRPTPLERALSGCQPSGPLAYSERVARDINDKLCNIVGERDTDEAERIRGHNFTVSALGLDSIQLMMLTTHLRAVYNLNVPISCFGSKRYTVRDLADLTESKSVDGSVRGIDVMEEARGILKTLVTRLRSKTTAPLLQPEGVCRNVLLTGASGFLGLEILQQLLRHRGIHVFILLRCGTEQDGVERLRSHAKRNGWWDESLMSRIHIWRGDIAKHHLGLQPLVVPQLLGQSSKANNIHAIIHCGAQVRYNDSYEALKASNVDSTTQLLETTAKSTSIGTFLYVSGGVMPSSNEQEELSSEKLASLNGYSQSKLVSELIVRGCAAHCAFQGRRILSIRPGYIIASPKNRSATVQTDFIWRLVAACVSSRSYNSDGDTRWLCISDVQKVARHMVAAVFKQKAAVSPAILDGLAVGEFWNILKSDFGYILQPLKQDIYVKAINSAIVQQQELHPLFAFYDVLEGEIGQFGSCTELAISDSTIRRAIRSNIQYLIDVGFLPAPPSRLAMATDNDLDADNSLLAEA
ncbi:hypothetical protein FE257_010762 [Aspergillus nanangensis]|uniref:Carrier domain-containing protein n=1 Tax=Aspergillus nanangensis TaxID=2582783 RepID=A0AAD4CVG7_ASPNN|nr:hypothetical protein FE257_010762 [Aspergillus nanangensis]